MNGHKLGQSIYLMEYTNVDSSKFPDFFLRNLDHIPAPQLDALLKDHIELELACVEILETAVRDWKVAANKTAYIRHAIAYHKHRAPEHTGNKWVANDFGQDEISNLVYVMVTEIIAHAKGKHTAKSAVPKSFAAKWRLCTNVHPSYQGHRITIAGQDKACGSAEEAQKYIDGRKKAYSHLFQSEMPPIEKRWADSFSYMGVLLPWIRNIEIFEDGKLA